jgi:uncharacterized membrane protein YkvA (DUF1232 family)
MDFWQWTLVCLLAALGLYLGFVLLLLVLGRREDARAIGGFIPDCVVLFRRLLGDERVPRGRKALLVAVVVYLAIPIDLIPDFIPVAGQLDDAIIVALVVRSVLRSGGPELLREHWPGPDASLDALLKLAYGRKAPGSPRPAETD